MRLPRWKSCEREFPFQPVGSNLDGYGGDRGGVWWWWQEAGKVGQAGMEGFDGSCS